MQYDVNNISKPTLYAPTDTASETGKTALPMAQKGILDDKIKKLVDREEITEDNPKRAFKTLYGQCTESIFANMGVGGWVENTKTSRRTKTLLKC